MDAIPRGVINGQVLGFAHLAGQSFRFRGDVVISPAGLHIKPSLPVKGFNQQLTGIEMIAIPEGLKLNGSPIELEAGQIIRGNCIVGSDGIPMVSDVRSVVFSDPTLT